MSRGIKVSVTLDLLLGMVGVDNDGIQLCGVELENDLLNVFTLALCGTSEQLPEVPEGGKYPIGTIIVTRTDDGRVKGEIVAT